MSIFKKTIKALGFSGEDGEMDSHPYTAENITNACLRDKTPSDETPVNQADPTGDASEELQLPDTLLDVLVEMLNRSLPDYALVALDKEAEKKYLFNQLDDSFKKFVAEVNERSRKLVARKWEAKHQALAKEAEEMRVKMKELEEQRNVMQNAQLSAERQKRAVSEKVHELETRIATLEAEKEQFELENKSLVNKLKVSNVHQEEVDSAMAEITRLQGELKKQNENATEVDRLQNELQQAQAELSQAKEKELEITNKSETVRQELSRQEEKIAQLLEQIQKLENELSEAQQGLKVVEEVETKLQHFEQIKATKDEKIAQLMNSLQNAEAENKQLHTRFEHLVQQQKQQEERMVRVESADKQELEALKSELEKANAMVAALRNQRQELLAQIDELKNATATPIVSNEQSVEAPAEDKKSESKIINFDLLPNEEKTEPAPESEETKIEMTDTKPRSTGTKVISAKPVDEKPQQRVEESPDDDFPGFDTFGDNWLIPTRPDTPEMIAKRKEEEKKKREAEEQAALAQKKAQQVDPSQMSLW